MKKNRLVVSLIVLLTPMVSLAQSIADPNRLSDTAIREILMQRVGEDRDHIGIVVGIIEPEARRIVAYGSTGGDEPRPVDGDTVFEIGSVTKVFTSLLLADMVGNGELTLDDPISDYLPSNVTVPTRGMSAITFVDLATHTSGLPRLPDNMSPEDTENPYADYGVEQLYAFLSGYELPRDIGSQYEYSNYGAGLLGHVLSRVAGGDYGTVIRTRIAEPLGMNSTSVALSPEMDARLAVGHNVRREPVSNWDAPTLAGAGALRSTANDMLSFLSLHLGYESSELSPAAATMHSVRRPAGQAGEIALGWHILPGDETEYVWHNGGTGGYRSFVGYNPVAGFGVVALTNLSAPAGVDDLGRHLLDTSVPLLPPDSPLLQAPPERTEISLEPELLETYVGRYELAPNVLFIVTREGDQLSVQLTGQAAAEIYPETETQFFMTVVDAQITFQKDTQDRVNALVLTQLGRDQIAGRLDTDADPIDEWFGHRENAVDPSIFEAYVGEYQLQPGAIFSVTREADGLFVQLTGQPRLEIFAESEREYFYKVVDAQITFEVDGDGSAPALILHQNGQDLRAGRIR